jgi:pimeloyl-ACP methyl ester carboxylesterase
MNLERRPMQRFASGDVELAFLDAGVADGSPVVLVHGFASTAHVNWVHPGWVKTLGQAGHRVVALDHRGHGESDKPHDPAVYTPEIMAGDVRALMDHLGIDRAHVFGYSMGARIAAFLGLASPDRVRTLVFGGLGSGLVEGVGEWDVIADALLAESLDDVTDPRGRMFRTFAEQTRSDRVALAACIRTSRKSLAPSELAGLTMPVLVGVGTRDDIGGSAGKLAEMLPDGRALDIPGRDHMLAVGDKVFKKAVVEFYEALEDRGR